MISRESPGKVGKNKTQIIEGQKGGASRVQKGALLPLWQQGMESRAEAKASDSVPVRLGVWGALVSAVYLSEFCYLGLTGHRQEGEETAKGAQKNCEALRKLSLDLEMVHMEAQFWEFSRTEFSPIIVGSRGTRTKGSLVQEVARVMKEHCAGYWEDRWSDRTTQSQWTELTGLVELASFTQPRTVNKQGNRLREAMLNTDFSDDYVNKQIVAMYFLVTHMNFVINEDLMVGQNLGFKWINRHNSM